MSDTTTNSIEYIRTVALEVTQKNLLKSTNPAKRRQLLVDLIALIEGHRLYLLSSRGELEEFWAKVRASRGLTDLILTSSIEFRLRATSSIGGWNVLATRLVEAYAMNRVERAGGGSVIDQDTLESMPEHNTLSDLLQANPWLVYVLVLGTVSLTEFFSELINKVDPAARGVRQ